MSPREAAAAAASTDWNTSRTNGDCHGYYLRWSRLTKQVEIKDNTGGLLGSSSIATTAFRHRHKSRSGSLHTTTTTQQQQHKTILNSVSGYAAPGEILAIMGPSGSGKTTLMNILAGRALYQHGSLSVNGCLATPSRRKRFQTQVAYVQQDDVFFEHLTVTDQLTYTALLRMPPSTTTTTNRKDAAVQGMIRQLRLQSVAASPIRLLSGGEKKRVNIGTELLTQPAVLLLDEPTSGLDSTSAISLLHLLHDISRHATVVTSMHQPSSAVFQQCFDRLLLLSEGKCVYFGTPADSLLYLQQQGLACPVGYNAADHWMDLLVVDSAVEQERMEGYHDQQQQQQVDDDIQDESAPVAGELRLQAQRMVSPRFRLQEAWDNEAVAEQMDLALVNNNNNLDQLTTTTSTNSSSKYNTTWTTQFFVLTHRALKNSQSAIFTPLNLIKSLAIGVVAGLLWFQMEYTERNIDDIRGYYFFTMTFWVFDSMFGALTSFPSERTVILKERASGSFRLSAYFMAKTTADAPVRLTLPLLYMVVSYWMIGFTSDMVVFFGTVGCTLLSVLAGEAVGLLVGALIYDLQKAITVMTVGMLFLMLLGGFYIENIPDFISWARYLSPFKYAFDSSLQLALGSDVPCDGSGALEELCGGATTGVAQSQQVRDFVGLQGSMGFNVGMLLVLIFVPRYWAYLALRMKKQNERS